MKRSGVRSYEDLTDNSRLLRRNQKHLKKLHESKCHNALSEELVTEELFRESNEIANVPADKQQTCTDQMLQKLPAKFIPWRSG